MSEQVQLQQSKFGKNQALYHSNAINILNYLDEVKIANLTIFYRKVIPKKSI